MIIPSGEDEPTAYESPEQAGEAITHGVHGDYGTKYVLKVSTELVAEYSRPWALIRKA
jgi:hypothetical protein